MSLFTKEKKACFKGKRNFLNQKRILFKQKGQDFLVMYQTKGEERIVHTIRFEI